MTRIKVTQLEIGQQLREDAVNTSGRLLLKAGTTIEAKHMEVFRTWGVVEVDIVGDDLNKDTSNISFSALPPEIKEQIKRELKLQFSHNDFKHPLIKELVTYQKVSLIKKYLEDGASKS